MLSESATPKSVSLDQPLQANRDVESSESALVSENADLAWYSHHSGWRLIDLRELWQYRDLIGMLTARDLKIRYRQTAIGVAWAILQPLTSMLIFTGLFHLLGKNPTSQSVPYPVMALCGLLPWQLFAGSLNQATQSLVANQHLITKVYFPRVVLPIASILTGVVDFLIACVILVFVMLWYGIAPTWTMLALPVFVGLTVLAAFAASLWLSAANGLYRDFGFVVPFLIQVGFYISPVVYETNALIPEKWRFLYDLNPLAGILEGFRWAILDHAPPPWEALAISLITLSMLFIGGMLYFRRVERFLADRI